MTAPLQFYLELSNRLATLESRIEILTLQNQALAAENAALKKSNLALTIENSELKNRLGLNSKNSSIPSSKELYKIKRSNPVRSGKKIGAQLGRKGYMRDAMVADEIIQINLDSNLCACGGELEILEKSHIHQKIEIPAIKPYVTEYHMQKGSCKSCGKKKKAKLPPGVTSDLFGPRVKSIIGSLTGFYKNSKREVQSILQDIFNLKISLGTISNSEARVGASLQEAYEDIELELSYSKLLHIDETSHYNKGKLGWCWMFTNNVASLIKLTESRGMRVLENSVFGQDDSVIVTDRYAAYNYFAAEKGKFVGRI